MKFLNNYHILLAILLAYSLNAQESDPPPYTIDSNIMMLNVTHTSKRSGSDSTLFFNYFFSQKCKNFFYEIDQKNRSIIFSFTNTRLGGFVINDSIIEINKGMLKKLQLKEHVEDRNKDIRGLKPEYYYITTATLTCDKIPINENIITVTENDNMISVALPWPGSVLERDSLYIVPQKKRRSGFIITLTSVGTATLAGTGVLLWTLLSGKDDNGSELPVNLPDHPSPQ